MATVDFTTTLAVNAAFLQEIKEVNQDLWTLLTRIRRLCADPLDARTHLGQLEEAFEELRDQLALHFALEEAYGYFEGPAVFEPRLSHRAGELRAQHRVLYRDAIQLAESVQQIRRCGSSWESLHLLIREFDAFDQRFHDHESWENELIQEEYDSDIGAGD